MATIYFSSTYEDLKDYRRVASEALCKSGHQVITMEDYVSADQLPVDLITTIRIAFRLPSWSFVMHERRTYSPRSSGSANIPLQS